jgi:trehalose 6-phosphate phosphatase
MNSWSELPPWNPRWAMFLDVDGTLLEIVAHPDQVRAGPKLRELLAAAAHALDGALALVSGRSIASLDEIFSPLGLPAAGLHGLERRDAHGRVHYPAGYGERIAAARGGLLEFVQSRPGLLLEDKGAALALHFRGAPSLEGQCRRQMDRALAAAGEDFHIQQGKMVLELKPSGRDKGAAIADFMQESPFFGRQPLFIGDDLTDEDGFRAVNAADGVSIRVGALPGSAARLVAPDVAAILAWLAACLERRLAPAE